MERENREREREIVREFLQGRKKRERWDVHTDGKVQELPKKL